MEAFVSRAAGEVPPEELDGLLTDGSTAIIEVEGKRLVLEREMRGLLDDLPLRFEQAAGLGRLARRYADALQEITDLRELVAAVRSRGEGRRFTR